MTEGRHLRTLDRLRQSDLPALNALFGRHPIPEFGERPDDSDPGEVETPDDDARTYATGQTEQTVTSPLLNDPEDAVTICPSCGIDLEVDNPGCLEHPFA
jgi:hypothetical protein